MNKLKRNFLTLESIVIVILVLGMIILLIQNRLLLRETENKNLTTMLPNTISQMSSYLYSSSFLGRKFPIIKIKNIINNQLSETIFSKPTIVILISRQGCSPCLRTELSLLQKFKEFYSDSLDFDVLGIGLEESEKEMLILRKLTNVTFPLFSDEMGHIKKWCHLEHFPLVFLVNESQQILLSHYPIRGNIEHSKRNLNLLAQFLSQDDRVVSSLLGKIK